MQYPNWRPGTVTLQDALPDSKSLLTQEAFAVEKEQPLLGSRSPKKTGQCYGAEQCISTGTLQAFRVLERKMDR